MILNQRKEKEDGMQYRCHLYRIYLENKGIGGGDGCGNTCW